MHFELVFSLPISSILRSSDALCLTHANQKLKNEKLLNFFKYKEIGKIIYKLIENTADGFWSRATLVEFMARPRFFF